MSIIDDKFISFKNDIQKIQVKPTVYVSYTGSKAAQHLGQEMFNNMIDEFQNINTISKGKLSVFVDESNDMVTFEDDGRGISFDELENACTIVHSGTKFYREHGSTAGENGVGLTATNALSEVFEITSYRDGRAKYLKFENGVKTHDNEMSVRSKSKHGLTVTFKPSRKYLGPDTKFPTKDFEIWLTKMSYFMPPEISTTFTVEYAGKQAAYKKVFKNDKGISGYLLNFEPQCNLLKSALVINNSMTKIEKNVLVYDGDNQTSYKDIPRTIAISVALNYNPDGQLNEPVKHSYCNNIENIEHGEHTNGVITAIKQFFKRKATESLKKSDTFDIVDNDILSGLGVVLNLNTDMSTGFENQTKHKLGNRDFYEPVRRLVMDALTKFFILPENKKILTKLCDLFKSNARIRCDIMKAKTKSRKQNSVSFLEATRIKGYTPPNNISDKNAYRELYIVEGESAGGGVVAGRFDNNIQGVWGLFGKPDNTYGKPSTSLKQGSTMRVLFTDVLQCGYGNTFNIDNLMYDKIIIDTDADVDGGHIYGLFISNIYHHAPELIKQGHVYRCVTPLYEIRTNKKKRDNAVNRESFLYSKEDFFKYYESEVSKKIKLKIHKNDSFMNKSQMNKFISVNTDYYDLLCELERYYPMHSDIFELIAYDNINNINKYAPEMSYDNDTECLSGIYKGEYYSVITSDDLSYKLKKLRKIIIEGNNDNLFYHMYLTKGSETAYDNRYTIGQIVRFCEDFEPDILRRFKGLGELGERNLNELTMNPYNRKLYRITIDDAERAKQTMDNLFLKSTSSIRKQMLSDYDIGIDDIDS